jgi:hypothetical protein
VTAHLAETTARVRRAPVLLDIRPDIPWLCWALPTAQSQMGYSEGETAPMPAHETASQDITVDVPTRPMINDAGDSDAELEREKVLADAGDDKNDEFSVPPGYRMLYLGVHRVVHSPPPSFSSSFSIFFGGAVTDRFRGLVKTIPSVAWFFREVYNVNPSLSAIDIGLELLTTLSPTAGLYINDRMLNLVCLISMIILNLLKH